jgi:hypothetical protein
MYINDFLNLDKVKTHYDHLIWTLDWEIISFVLHKYKKTNKIIFFEILKKQLTYVKLTQLAFQECKKHSKIMDIQKTNKLLNFGNSFNCTCKTREYELLFYNVLILYI